MSSGNDDLLFGFDPYESENARYRPMLPGTKECAQCALKLKMHDFRYKPPQSKSLPKRVEFTSPSLHGAHWLKILLSPTPSCFSLSTVLRAVCRPLLLQSRDQRQKARPNGLPGLHTATIMFRFTVFLALSLSKVWAQDSDALKAALDAAGVRAVYPSDSTYANASAAYNLRYTIKPLAVAYPTNAEQVASIMSAAAAQNISIAARGGGHSYAALGLGQSILKNLLAQAYRERGRRRGQRPSRRSGQLGCHQR